MQIFFDATWEHFLADVDTAREGIVVFGASSSGKMFLTELNRCFKAKYVVDNDVNKQNKSWLSEYTVYNPDKLKESNSAEILVITSQFYSEILEQLKTIGYKGKVYSFLHLRKNVSGYSSKENLEKFKSLLPNLYQLMADQKSRDILDAIYQKRLKNTFNYSDIMEGQEYFFEGIIKKNKDAVFIDGGAYKGETVKEFIKYQKGCFKKVYSFEMDSENFSEINQSEFDNRVVFYNYGLWGERKTLSYMSSQTGSSIAEFGARTVECVALDDVIDKMEKVTFIKLDIEGAEKNALMGAKRIITEQKPQLAICLYHKAEDIWELPLLIHELVPEYQFYIRHHGKMVYDTVLYAVLPEK